MRSILLITVLFVLPNFLSAQCGAGEVEVFIEVTTDDYGYETYWELLPNGSPCGSNTIFAGSNALVGCNGAGLQLQNPGGYGNGLVITEGPFCLVQGVAYDIFWADDYGDAGLSFEVFVNGVSSASFVGTGAGETFTFIADLPPSRDMAVTKMITALFAYRDVPVAVKGELRSLGADPVTSFDLNYTVDGGTPVVQSVGPVNLTAGDYHPFEHAQPWVPASTGAFTIEVWASNINGGADLNTSNDLGTAAVKVNEAIPDIIAQYLYGTPVLDVIATSNEDILVPRDLDFHPDFERNELWVINKDTEASGGSTVKFTNAGEAGMTFLMQEDVNNWHFMSLPTGIAFADNNNFATCPGVFDANHNPGDGVYFTGPTLWSSDPDIYAQNLFGPLGSHLDMLHVTPYSQGIAHEHWNKFWVVDGYNGDVVMHDFRTDHGPGMDYHGDAIIRRYADFTITKDPNDHIVSHCAMDKATGWLYVVDHGGDRVLRLNTATGSASGPGNFGPYETYVEYSMVSSYDWEEIISSGLVEPAGIEVIGDHLLVSDHATGEVIIYDLSGPVVAELGRVDAGGPGLMGIKVGPDGRIWGVNATTHSLVRISPDATVGSEEVLGSTLMLRPNPAVDRLFVSGLDASTAIGPVLVQDATGRVVMRQLFGDLRNGLDVGALLPGSYSVRIGASSARFVKR
ncbi:MAG: hypothetical protein IPK99_03035 [Flavobacteriales bacterium]|nr:hypothetical protein [Flavobacteriales bacterium]